MTSAEYEALPRAVAEWIERLYVAADGGNLPAGIEWVVQNGRAEDVITLHTERHEADAKRRALAADIDSFYGGKL